MDYCKYIDIPGVPFSDTDPNCEEFYADKVAPALHHILLLDALSKVISGEIKRLMVFMPPGSAKSTYASVVFPTFLMGKKPRTNVIAVSYSSDQATRFGRRCRSVTRSTEFKELFGCELTGDNKAADDWSLTNDSTYMAAGIQAGITGNRADCLLIDDPVRGRDQADSPGIRDKVWDEYLASADSRLKPNGAQIIIQTRWHEDDLSGRMLPVGYSGESGWITSQQGEKWFVICLAAQAERADDPLGRSQGEWLWPEWFTPDWWAAKKLKQGPRNWNALYQQRPAPETGDFFQKDWLRPCAAPPRTSLRVYGASDYAVTSDGGDYTVHVIVGIDHDDKLYLLDLWRGQASSDVWVEAFCDLVLKWKPIGWAEEMGQIKAALGPYLDRRSRERRAFVARTSFPTKGDKSVRAQSIRGRMALSGLYLPFDAPWRPELEAELMSFPAGRHDDQVDALGLVGQLLDRMVAPSVEDAPKAKRDGWDRAFASQDDDDLNWRVA